jgi:hypothetical protein
MEDSNQSKGGQQRAVVLSVEQRHEIAQKAAEARWKRLEDPNYVGEASHRGDLPIGDLSLECYVLADKRRVFHKRGFAKALALRSTSGTAFTRLLETKGIGPQLGTKLLEKLEKPIVFKDMTLGRECHGYEVTLLIDICDAILRAREKGLLGANQYEIGMQAEAIMRATAKVGIVALVDEATGFIADKRKEEYRELFAGFIRESAREWEKEYPPQFFDMIYRLYSLRRKENFKNHPSFFAGFIRKYVYFPLAGSRGLILEELEKKNPVVYSSGGRKHKFHEFLEQVGVLALRQHIWQLIGIGNVCRDSKIFDKNFQKAFGNQQEFDFPELDD